MLRGNLYHMGKLPRQEIQQRKWETKWISTATHNHGFHFLCCRCRSWTWTFHFTFRCILFKHSWTRFPSNHGIVCALARSTRPRQMDHVERYWIDNFCTDRSRVWQLFITHWHHCIILKTIMNCWLKNIIIMWRLRIIMHLICYTN